MAPTSSGSLRTWVRVCLAFGFAVFAALACLFWVSNGIVAGALIGLPGREGDVNVAQHHALIWFTLCLVFLLAQVAVVYSLVPLGEDAGHLARFVARVPFRLRSQSRAPPSWFGWRLSLRGIFTTDPSRRSHRMVNE